MELLLEVLVYLVAELVLPAALELLAELGFGALGRGAKRARGGVLPALGLLLLGATAGGLSVWVLPQRLGSPGPFRGASLVLAPLALGALMSAWGGHRRTRGHETTVLASFWGGAAFAFGFALARFLGVG
jgi:hypothetical protein